ncbi:hypothetical protein BDK51DRAFT_50479 [Blyttiomyces helicus]|uniref:Uncharacterized protein n=1 Tax=Blyttiomyces helicus TaxID=388810 RepID=A0A4P9WJK3_9FUNG|nr:hypothetical protein BDK51DRAFT_50479 [Blyttiomyces helicus]|eukprot:RKO93111.1 hypothetical protein BDK51DRAFT_50479 [Blyttiomyces helicus]
MQVGLAPKVQGIAYLATSCIEALKLSKDPENLQQCTSNLLKLDILTAVESVSSAQAAPSSHYKYDVSQTETAGEYILDGFMRHCVHRPLLRLMDTKIVWAFQFRAALPYLHLMWESATGSFKGADVMRQMNVESKHLEMCCGRYLHLFRGSTESWALPIANGNKFKLHAWFGSTPPAFKDKVDQKAIVPQVRKGYVGYKLEYHLFEEGARKGCRGTGGEAARLDGGQHATRDDPGG